MPVVKKKKENFWLPSFKLRSQSISRNLTISLLFIVMLVEVTLLAYIYQTQSRAMLRDIELKAEDYAAKLSEVLAVPVWDFDDEQIRKIGFGFLQNDIVEKIYISDSKGKTLFNPNVPIISKNNIKRSENIVYEDQLIGRVDLYLSLKRYMQKLIWLRNSILLFLAGSLTVIFIATGILLRIFMRKPFNIFLQSMDQIARGDFAHGFEKIRYRELLGIANRFCQMAAEIQSRENSFQLMNQELQEEILERKRVEEALRKSEERYRQYFEEDLSGAYISDPNGRLITCNPAFARILGFTSIEEVMHTNLNSIYRDPDSRKIFLSRLGNQKKLEQHETTLINSKGAQVHVIENAVGVFDEMDQLVEIKGYLIDVTEQKNLEMRLRQALKMEAVGTLAGGIAHDFNNLLMAIEGNISLMLYDLDSNHPHYEKLRRIEKSVCSGAKLTSQLLGYARKGRYEVKPINLNQIVEETSETIGRTKKEITIYRYLAKDLMAVKADPGQIEQVLLNLYVNALDAMKEGGKMILRTMNITHKDMHDKIYVTKPGRYVLLTVADNGAGMDKRTQERIFDPFFTTKEMGKGTGLGLASVYGIIKGHGGYIDVDSKLGKGTIFSIYLPASYNGFEETVENAEQIIEGKGTILLVDDEAMILDVSAQMLRRFGYSVIEVCSGKEAIEVYKENNAKIDMVILDIVMPDIGAAETYDKLKEIDPNVKVLLSSGYSIEGKASEIMKRGCKGFIQKPFNMEQLSKKISEILEKEDFSNE
ncbi:MAG: response regulator [Desulfobacterales bacterium]|nr:response regulator [Desulfobacterales bacterium]